MNMADIRGDILCWFNARLKIYSKRDVMGYGDDEEIVEKQKTWIADTFTNASIPFDETEDGGFEIIYYSDFPKACDKLGLLRDEGVAVDGDYMLVDLNRGDGEQCMGTLYLEVNTGNIASVASFLI